MININTQKTLWYTLILILVIILIKITPFYNIPFSKVLDEKTNIAIFSKKELSLSEWLIIINWQNKKNIKIINGLKYLPLNLEKWQKISFAAKEIYKDVHFFIKFTGNIIKIYPQSAIYINNTWKNINIVIIWWIIQYLNTDPNNQITFEWNIKPFKLNLNDSILKNILEDEKNKQKNNIIKSYWWNILLNKTFDFIVYNLLISLNKIFPKYFSDNLENYYKFKNYILNSDLNSWFNLDFKWNEKTNINKDILKQFNKWLWKIVNNF